MLKILMVLIISIALLIYYVVYKFCKIASNSDNQKLEDELFLNIYESQNENGD